MLIKTKRAVAVLLNAWSEYSGNVLFAELHALANCAVNEGFVNWYINGGYIVPNEEAPEASETPDLRTETLEQLVALFEAFEAHNDAMFNRRLDDLGDYLRGCGWIDITNNEGHVVSAAKTPVLPYEALELIAYILNAHMNEAYLTLHDGLARLSGYLVQTGLLIRSKGEGYSVPETEPRIIPFLKED